jgi:hypothetical protein
MTRRSVKKKELPAWRVFDEADFALPPPPPTAERIKEEAELQGMDRKEILALEKDCRGSLKRIWQSLYDRGVPCPYNTPFKFLEWFNRERKRAGMSVKFSPEEFKEWRSRDHGPESALFKSFVETA